jgi:hypothetical protein
MPRKEEFAAWRQSKDNFLRVIHHSRVTNPQKPIAQRYRLDPRDIVLASETWMDDWAKYLTIMAVYRPYYSNPPLQIGYIPLPGTRKQIRKWGFAWNQDEKCLACANFREMPPNLAAQFAEWLNEVLPSINWDKIVAKNN